jgi:transposase InsO family protein
MIKVLATAYPVTLVCKVLGCSRSSYYYREQVAVDGALQEAILAVAAEWPTYGYRRMTAELRRRGWVVNHKRVCHLMDEMGLKVKVKRKRRRTTNSDHPFPRYPNLVLGLGVVYPDQVWVADITYVRLGQGFVYLAVIMDVFTRAIRGWNLSRSLEERLTLTALQQALNAHHVPGIHHSDQGIQYAAMDYTAMLQAHHVQISMAEIGEPTQNGFAERLMRTIKEEEVDLSEYQDYADARRQIGRFLEDVYMRKRIHSSLGYLTPLEFEEQWVSGNTCFDPA